MSKKPGAAAGASAELPAASAVAARCFLFPFLPFSAALKSAFSLSHSFFLWPGFWQ